ncbi:GIY-YIG nuclease family protein [Kaarinaea lacus]
MRPDEDWESFVIRRPDLVTYQLYIHLDESQPIVIGRLGSFNFSAGMYVYTGSAKRNLVSRVMRHLADNKKIRWHIDYLLDEKDARIVELGFSTRPECLVNKQSCGEIVIPGFGASDCKNKCSSHLKYQGAV